MDLFEKNALSRAPLAERMRPRTLEGFFGQQHLVGESRILRNMLEGQQLTSIILWGPPGVGKTTLAKLLSTKTQSKFISISAVSSGVKEMKAIVAEAQERLRLYRRQTILFVDEIHRFNKAQQDYLLPFVENGTLILIGATTENPSFEVNSALLSRTKVLTFNRLTEEDLKKLIQHVLKDTTQGLGKQELRITAKALDFLAASANGDARSVLNAIELIGHLCQKANTKDIKLDVVATAIQKKHLYYDKGAEEHYNIISAFIKSMRGSDPDGAIYWMCRMLEGGEDPLFIARRMVIFASEDIGNADPHALPLAIATMQAVDFIGLPEGKIPLAQAATYLATAKKSNASYVALKKATQDVNDRGNLEVPLHLRNAPTKLMKNLGYSDGYQYAHDQKDGKVTHAHLPKQLTGRKYYTPPL